MAMTESFVTKRGRRFAALATSIAVCLLSATASAQQRIRIATYNASLHGQTSGEIARRLASGSDSQADKVAAIVQTVRPDVLLINELDHDADVDTAQLLAKQFFAHARGGRKAIEYPFVFSIPSNTGVDSGLDLDRNGARGEPGDAWGFGAYEGQYAMALFSRYPIVMEEGQP